MNGNMNFKNGLEISLRSHALPSDVTDIVKLCVISGVFSEKEILIARELIEDRLEKGDKSEYLFLFAESKGRVVGYICYGLIKEDGDDWDVYWIVVDKELHNHGIGSRLLNEVQRRIKEASGRNVYIETSSTPPYCNTREFYFRHGYRICDEEPDFYGAGDNKLTYLKTLPI